MYVTAVGAENRLLSDLLAVYVIPLGAIESATEAVAYYNWLHSYCKTFSFFEIDKGTL